MASQENAASTRTLKKCDSSTASDLEALAESAMIHTGAIPDELSFMYQEKRAMYKKTINTLHWHPASYKLKTPLLFTNENPFNEQKVPGKVFRASGQG